ncbi:uncharacterized protein LOC121371957 [Gigantopelta aegis]|uniref:uncharacterized protein LOC121371957 n=1 Tax=Gigantopelta aegis TaxID=1735272 RepID=UPI001B887525|nr:uncharacterized protein LOC121371957 [Gigantopelta aegis]
MIFHKKFYIYVIILFVLLPLLDQDLNFRVSEKPVTLTNQTKESTSPECETKLGQEESVIPIKNYLLRLSGVFVLNIGVTYLCVFTLRRYKVKYNIKNPVNPQSAISSTWRFFQKICATAASATATHDVTWSDVDLDTETTWNNSQLAVVGQASRSSSAHHMNYPEWVMVPDSSCEGGVMWHREVEMAERAGNLEHALDDCPDWARVDLVSQTETHSVDFPPPLFDVLDLYQTLPTIYEKD